MCSPSPSMHALTAQTDEKVLNECDRAKGHVLKFCTVMTVRVHI